MRDVKQYPLLTWEAPECAELRRLSWRFYRLRWLFWVLQVLIVVIAWMMTATLWENPPPVPLDVPLRPLSLGGFTTLLLMVAFLWPLLKSRVAIDRHLQALTGELWQRQEPTPGLIAPWSLEDHAEFTYVFTAILTVFLMSVHGIAFLFGFNSVFFGYEFSPLAWSLAGLFVVGAIVDVWFDSRVQASKAQARLAYQAVRRQRSSQVQEGAGCVSPVA